MTLSDSEWQAALQDALPAANIPTLLLVLRQLTGDPAWLDQRYRCSRSQGIDENDSGGLDADRRAEIIAGAQSVLPRWCRAGMPAPALSPALLREMMAFSTGEPIPEGYGDLVAAGLYHQAPARPGWHAKVVPPGFRIVIIGAGIAGLCAAIRLQQAGIPYVVLEKNHSVGGTWHENRYPGAGVDTPSHIYAYSFAKHDWSMHFALRPEIQAYFDGVADRFGVRPNIRFGARVAAAAYNEQRRRWTIRYTDAAETAQTVEADALISAVGYLNTPRLPAIADLDRFAGPCFHTARWPQDLDLRGKRVAVVGNGATAMQVVPEVAKTAAALTVFQRSTQWAAPFARFRQPISDGARFLLTEVPYYQEWYRQRLLWIFNDRIHGALQIDPSWDQPDRAVNRQNDRHRQFFTDYIKAELGPRQDLLPLLLPDFPPFGKRMLLDNGWYRTMTRDNVRLVNSSAVRVTPDAIISGANEMIPADVLILATGFDAVNMLASFDLRGCGGRSIRTAWQDSGPRAYLGITIPGFPNFFVLAGPNTGLGHGGSVVATVESHVDYIVDALQHCLLTSGGRFEIEVRADICDAYDARVQAAHSNMIWTHKGMTNWYRNAQGRVVVITPFRNDQNWHATRCFELADFTLKT